MEPNPPLEKVEPNSRKLVDRWSQNLNELLSEINRSGINKYFNFLQKEVFCKKNISSLWGLNP